MNETVVFLIFVLIIIIIMAIGIYGAYTYEDRTPEEIDEWGRELP